MERLMLVSTLLSIALIAMVLFSLRRAHIRVEYSVSWLAAGFTIFILSRWEGALVWLGNLMGAPNRPTALFGIALGVLLFVVYRISMIVSELKDNNIALAQKVAILEFRLRAVQEGE
jgi:hypothetical protein